MPIYAYRCEGCGFQKDALQKLSDPPLVDCPECGRSRLVKQVTAAGFALKGTGWYVTDFRDSGKKSGTAETQKADTAAPAASGASAGSEPTSSSTQPASGDTAPSTATTSSSPAGSSVASSAGAGSA
ncbi:MAG: zinc ribbon domain-containing protein [Burkholderiaceae bacterium]|nr:zinc ribbon domain-containing protein [Burkholderiaceae bacterium]